MSEQDIFGGPIVWQPTAKYIKRAHLTHFMQKHEIHSFDELYKRSITEIPWFTTAVLDYLGIKFQTPYTQILNTDAGIAWPHWCVGGKLNIVESCLDRWIQAGQGEATALTWEAEDGRKSSLSYAQLESEVSRAANGLRSLGYSNGDRIGIYMPMTPEIVIALLAIAKIGAVALPLFSGYGAGAIAARLSDSQATGLFTSNRVHRRGKIVDMKATADSAIEDCPQIKHVIVHRYLQSETTMKSGRDLWFDELLSSVPAEASTAILDAEAPLMILYTSGTTGRPKGAVHTHCGFPVKAAQDMAFGTDVHPGDVIYWMTDLGWMMGPWLIFGALILGATAMLYDGAPDYPSHDRVWALCEQHRVNVLGVSPTLIRSLMPYGSEHPRKYNLTHIRSFASTGEPWNPGPWHWLFNEVGETQKPIINYSGGTEISGGILMGNPVTPLKACAFSAPCPGIWVDVLDENGESLQGEVGELVIKAPWIGMTRGFLNDPERYEQTYWSRWKDIWVHGDFAAVDPDGSWYILGRSDDTIKVAGKRVGPAEIESILVAMDGVIEAAVIGIPDEIKGSSLVAFCVIDEHLAPSQEFATQLKQHVIEGMGKPMAPKGIYFVPDLPKTRNAKVMRRMLRAAYLGEDPGDTSALVNPEVLDGIPQLSQDA
jgi:acetyl-CoA synthetase